MGLERFKAISEAQNRNLLDFELPKAKISEYFADNVFTDKMMQVYLNEEAYERVQEVIQDGRTIDREMANQVAIGLKNWAIDKGAKHYTHWFQPLTGLNAEKKETFFKASIDGKRLEFFNGDKLVQGEPDGANFPSGGLRTTHEARGYTAWDPTSPPFILEGKTGKTLYIPTIFISYSGDSLDYKAPLLKSLQFVEKAALDIVNLFDRNVDKVTTTLGWEQEFFLVDESLYNARPDLVVCGRTLVGHGPAKGQQLDDYYFNSIPERVHLFLQDLEVQAHLLGIPIETSHNEIAPGQFEITPSYGEANRSIDQNQLVMDLMKHVATRHHFRVLFHEKPFDGLNGSAKHNNWSLITDTGINLLAPGKTPKKNLQFLTIFINMIKAVNENADLLRTAVATPGNDYRLGQNEAPPPITSVFIGSKLTEILEEFSSLVKKGKMDDYDKQDLKVQIDKKLPSVLLDNTDANRTAPIAFTGNKFELRAVGSSTNCAFPITILNAVVGQQFVDFKDTIDELVKKGEKKDTAILQTLKNYIEDSKRILFEGDTYSEDWQKEAKKRKLSNIPSTAYALEFLKSSNAQKALVSSGIFKKNELDARYEVWQEQYQMKLQIDARMLGQIASSQILPVVWKYLNSLIENVKGLESIGFKEAEHTKAQKDLIAYILERTNRINENVVEMIQTRKRINKIENLSDKAKAYYNEVYPFFDKIRRDIDKLELIVDDQLWPLPKYRDLLFVR